MLHVYHMSLLTELCSLVSCVGYKHLGSYGAQTFIMSN
jgi:hypothetical protein